MAKKTAGVRDLVEDVLSSIPLPHTEDIIEDVFIRIENSPAWKTLYDKLLTELGRDLTHQWIGRYTKLLTDYQTGKHVAAKRTRLITAYSKLCF